MCQIRFVLFHFTFIGLGYPDVTFRAAEQTLSDIFVWLLKWSKMSWVRVFATVFQQKYTMGLFLFDITHFMVPLISVGANNDLLLKFQYSS